MKDRIRDLLELMMTGLLYDRNVIITEVQGDKSKQTFTRTGNIALKHQVGSGSISFEVSSLFEAEDGGPWEVMLLDRLQFPDPLEGTLEMGEHRLIALSRDQSLSIEIDMT